MEDVEEVGPAYADAQSSHGEALPTPLGTELDSQDPLHTSDFRLLQQALLNERMAPDILKYKGDLVERVKERLDDQDLYIEELEQQQGREMVRSLLALERDRLRWQLKAYLRARLVKVERFAAAVLDNPELRGRCSEAERRHANDYFVALGRHLKDTVLDQLPPNFRSLVKQFDGEQGKTMIEQLRVGTFVFCRALVNCGAVADGADGETVDMAAGDLHVIRYSSVADMVRAEQVCLL